MQQQHPQPSPLTSSHQGASAGVTTTSATAELRRVLATPPPTAAGTPWQPDYPNVNDNLSAKTTNAVAVAHAALQALRDAGDVQFLFLRTIVELCQYDNRSGTSRSHQDEELLFHCITGARHVVLTKWNSFSMRFRHVIRDYFMALGHQNTTSATQRTVKMAFYNASSSFWKRQWNDEPDVGSTANDSVVVKPPSSTNTMSLAEQTLVDEILRQRQVLHMTELAGKADLFQYLNHGITGPALSTDGHEAVAACCTFLSVLVGEFAGKSASNYNMPQEFHKKAHAAFEGNGWLDKSLEMSMKALSQVVGTLNNNNYNTQEIQLALIVVQLNTDLIGWEFGDAGWDSGGFPQTGQRSLIMPPASWRPVLVQPDFVKAIFHAHGKVAHENHGNTTTTSATAARLSHSLRQLLLLLSSLSGPVFVSQAEKQAFATLLLEGILSLISSTMATIANGSIDSLIPETSAAELLDTLSMISRLIVNYKLSALVEIPLMDSLLQGMANLGRYLLQENCKECEVARGDLEAMENREFREEALVLLLEGIVLLCGDPWLLYSGSKESRQAAQAALASTLAPLYAEFVTCRTRMARLEETYLAAHETELDEVREEIYAVDLEEEMSSLAIVGRLDLQSSLVCLAGLFANLVPQLQALWDAQVGVVTPEAAGLLEDSRLVTLYIGHLLTDDNTGETPVIPEAISAACENNQAVSDAVASAVQTVRQFAEFQASKIALHPSDPRLSPLLATSFLWLLSRWAPAYILPVDYSSSSTPSTIFHVWSSPARVQEMVDFLVTLCLHYNCYWPQEGQVQENSSLLLLSLAKRCTKMRLAMVASPPFRQLETFQCLTCGIRHCASQEEFVATVTSKSLTININMDMVRGYHRLPYVVRAKVLTAVLVACSEQDDTSSALMNDCLKSIQDAFSSLVNVLSTKQMSPNSVDAREMAGLCVEMYGGVARAGDMVGSERIPTFVTPQLLQLSGLMTFYAEDLSICESLLRFFRDYTERFIAVLDPNACLVLFQASSDLLKSYSNHHCSSKRVIVPQVAEEEQAYDDVLCAIDLLIQLGTKDFLDIGDSTGITSNQVTDMIFFGLQQILPLMTRGLLQFPTLCSQYFSLVGFMMEMYPQKVKNLPFDLFDALLESLLVGMSHHDTSIGKYSLQGLAGIAREHLEHRVLDGHITTSQNHEGLIDKCCRRLLMEVVFQNIVWDRLEPAGSALLPLAAIDLTRFAVVVQGITQQIPPENHVRLMAAFEGLLKPELLNKITLGGYEGRKNRIMFKKDFETFCHEIHAFIVVK